MSQITLFDSTANEPEQPVVEPVDQVPVEVEAEPVPAAQGYNMTETSMPWRAFVEGRWTPYEVAVHPTDPVRFTSQCPHCRCSFALTVPLAELDPDAIYCLTLGGAWSPRLDIPCWTCARRVVEFLIKLIKL